MTLTRSGSEIAHWFAEALGAPVAMEGGSGPEAALVGPDGGPLRARYNLCPSQDVLTLAAAPAEAGLAGWLAWRRWGLIPHWAKDPGMGARTFNARSETVAEKPSFRAAFRRRRCLVVADGFYEWTPKSEDHQPFHFRAAAGPLLAFAGLFETWHGEGGEVIESCTVLTTDAGPDVEGVHHRMPVVLAPQALGAWIAPETSAEVLLEMTRPAPKGTLERVAVSRYVNNPRHDDPACLAPEPEQGGLFGGEGGE